MSLSEKIKVASSPLPMFKRENIRAMSKMGQYIADFLEKENVIRIIDTTEAEA